MLTYRVTYTRFARFSFTTVKHLRFIAIIRTCYHEVHKFSKRSTGTALYFVEPKWKSQLGLPLLNFCSDKFFRYHPSLLTTKLIDSTGITEIRWFFTSINVFSVQQNRW